MVQRIQGNGKDTSSAGCVVVGNMIYFGHYSGGYDRQDIAHQMRGVMESLRETLAFAGATLDDLVQINLYLRNLSQFHEAREVLRTYISEGCFPARTTLTTEFIDAECLCMISGIACKPDTDR